MTPNEMANQLVAAGRSLITVLDEESAALTAARMSAVPEILEQKETAAASYPRRRAGLTPTSTNPRVPLRVQPSTGTS